MRTLAPVFLLFLTGCGGPAAASSPEAPAQLPGPAQDAAASAEGAEEGGVDLGFLITRGTGFDPHAVVVAASGLGLKLRPQPASDDESAPHGFSVAGGGQLFVMPVEVAHPDAPHMPANMLSPEPAEVTATDAHFVVTAMGLPGDLRQRDATMARLLAATVRGTDAVGAMLHPGVLFYKAELFADLVGATPPGELPLEVLVDLTLAPEPDGRMSVLTHGLVRYGREEFYVTAPQDGEGVVGFTMGMVRWMVMDPSKELPTGDTVGRTADEKLIVQRVPSPTGEGPEVIRLDMP